MMTATRYRVAALVAIVSGAGAALAGVWAARGSGPWTTVVLVVAGVGLVAALAMVLFRAAEPSAVPEPTAALAQSPGRPPTGQVAVDDGEPTPARSSSQPRDVAAPTTTDREASGELVRRLGASDGPPTDPRTTAPVVEHRNLLAKQSALLRGLADLSAQLPDEFAWQAWKLLEAAGARQIAPQPGTPFEAAMHHVLDVEPTSVEGRGNTVAHTLRPGWHDPEHDQVLVPAQVVLFAAPDHAAREFDDDRQ